MYLIFTAFAAIISTIIWYFNSSNDKYKTGTLCFVFWGAAFMWFIDRVIACITKGEEFIEVSLDSVMLGITVIFFGLLLWLLVLSINYYKVILKKLKDKVYCTKN